MFNKLSLFTPNVHFCKPNIFIQGFRFIGKKTLKGRSFRRKENSKQDNAKTEPKPPENKNIDRNIETLLSTTKITVGISALYYIYHYFQNKAGKPVSLKEMDEEYLQKGEIKKIILPSGIFNLTTFELHLDPDRDHQRIRLPGVFPFTLRNYILQRENDLKVPKEERIPVEDFTFLELAMWIIISGGFTLARGRSTKGPIDAARIRDKYKAMRDDFNKIHKSEPTKSAQSKADSTTRKSSQSTSNIDIMSLLIGDNVSEYKVKSEIKFKDVAGLHAAKQEVREFLEYLNNPTKFIRLGAHLPRGAMLLGPPGCGKTHLVKALANECDVPFYYYAGSDFTHMIGGVGSKKVRKTFKAAAENAPAIIFIDEIDAIGGKRSQGSMDNSDRDQTLNQLLVEMDGMEPNSGVIIFGATNRADMLDRALIRAGRFDRHILIDLPFLEERKELFQLYLDKYGSKLMVPIVELRDRLAQTTPGMSGADIANLCNEAALTAARLNLDHINEECFNLAIERIIAGAAKKNQVLTESDRRVVAYHEAGHALTGWLLRYADPVIKVSIVPRTSSAIGFAQLLPRERYLLHVDLLRDRLAVLVAGRVAEAIIFTSVTSGAHDDLVKAKKLTFKMVREWGMSPVVGHLSFQVSDDADALGLQPYSGATKALIEAEANKLVAEAFRRAESLLKANIDKLEKLAQELLVREVLNYADIQKIIGPRDFDPDS